MTADPRTLFPVASSDPDHSPTNADSSSPDQVTKKKRASLHVWLLRTRALLFVTLCAIFGVLLLILPWTPKWTDNPLLLAYPELRGLVSSGFVRGLASGLGMLDLWLGFWEAIHYHETPS